MAEVFDVVRMILTAKEDLANDPVLAADGLSGEYAEKSLAEWEAALREAVELGDFDVLFLPYCIVGHTPMRRERVLRKGSGKWVGAVHEAASVVLPLTS